MTGNSRRLAFIVVAATSVALLGACSSGGTAANKSSSSTTGSNSASSGQSATKVKLIVLASGLATVLQGIAEHVNAFQHEGLDVSVQTTGSGNSTVAVQDLVQGRADAAFVDSSSVAALDSSFVSKGQSAPLKAVAATGNVSNVVLSSKIKYTGLESLKDLRLGISSTTSIHRANLDYTLTQAGLSESKLGIKWSVMGSGDMPGALASGQIDGFIHSEPTTTIAIQKDHAQLALSMGGAVRSAASNLVAVSADFVKKHPSTVKKLVAAYQYASDQYEAMPESTVIPIFASYAKAPASLMKAVHEQKDHYNPALLPLKSAADSYFKVGIPALVSQKAISEKLTEADMFDFQFSK